MVLFTCTGKNMASEHSESRHLIALGRRRLLIALGIVVFIMTAEAIGGLLSGSLALLGDAGHMLVDALALGMSVFAISIARRPATATRTFGYYRAEIFAALANGITLVLVVVFIFFEAYQRFLDPPPVRTTLMLVVAAIGLVANLATIWLLRGVSHGNLNIKAAFWHVVGDTMSSVGVITAGIIIALTGFNTADPIIAVVIGGIILWGAVMLVRESTDVLMETAPRHVRPEKVIAMIAAVPGVEAVHDLHIWTITSGIHALSAHLLIEDQMVSRSGEIIATVNRELVKTFNITHTTLQLECQNCSSGFVCNLGQTEDPGED
jgi:cobalt-zinc-cadmium efflux system protein